MTSETITVHHFNLIKKYLRGFEVPNGYPGDKADLFQVGLIGLMKAVKTHDPDKSRFSTWAWYWIRSEIRSEISRNVKQIKYYDEDKVPFKDNVLIMQLINMIKIPKDKDAVLRFLSGQTSNEIGNDWGVSRQSIDQRLARAYDNMRRTINVNESRLRTGRRLLRKANAQDRLDRIISC